MKLNRIAVVMLLFSLATFFTWSAVGHGSLSHSSMVNMVGAGSPPTGVNVGYAVTAAGVVIASAGAFATGTIVGAPAGVVLGVAGGALALIGLCIAAWYQE